MVVFLTICICILLAGMAVGGFYIANAEHKERLESEKELEEEKHHEQKTAEVISEASAAKSEARTGNHSHDLDYMANKLHEYADNNK